MGIWSRLEQCQCRTDGLWRSYAADTATRLPRIHAPGIDRKNCPELASQINMLSFGSKLDGKDIMQFDGYAARISLPAKTTSRTFTRMPGR